MNHANQSPRPQTLASLLASLLALFALTLPLAGNGPPAPPTRSAPPVRVPSDVAWTEDTLAIISHGDAFHGLLLARRCNHCHGEDGFSSVAAFPNLAGLDRLSFWKQMQDFRSGKRSSPLMQTIAEGLSPRDSADLAAYYALLPTASDPLAKRAFPQPMQDPSGATTAIRLIVFGDGQRGIPPCQSCHGPVSYVQGATPLAAQNGNYLAEQLDHFSDGSRTNDINVRMRSIAMQLTADEKAALSEYYGAGLGPGANSR